MDIGINLQAWPQLAGALTERTEAERLRRDLRNLGVSYRRGATVAEMRDLYDHSIRRLMRPSF